MSELVDPAKSCADNTLTRFLIQNEWQNPQKELPHYEFYVSDDPEKFRLLRKTFLSHPIEHVQLKAL